MPAPPAAALRPPSVVMQPRRMGAFHQTRLSFMRALLRDAAKEGWKFARTVWRVNKKGAGFAVYELREGARAYSLAVFCSDLPAEKRSDRVIAEEWDSVFTLCDGALTAEEAKEMRKDVLLQEAGRQRENQLVLSRANRSVRLFEHTADSLARGRQPKTSLMEEAGYLMRTTAVYANGKFGVADRERICGRAEMRAPFRAEMLAVWMFRVFAADIAEHLAFSRAPGAAAKLSAANRKRLGIGNATGLGMAPFLINHPQLLHKWMRAREIALARARAAEDDDTAREMFLREAKKAKAHAEQWRTDDKTQRQKITELQKDIARIIRRANRREKKTPQFWDLFYRWGEASLSLEGQEMLVSLMTEPRGDLVDGLAQEMSADESALFRVPGAQKVFAARRQLEKHYDWALEEDFSRAESRARFWYVSEEKMEPRLGECAREPGAELQLPLVVARDIREFHAALCAFDSRAPLAEFLLAQPQHRHSARRLNIARRCVYGELRGNLASARLLPTDMLRCKLSFFGATRFDPRSDRWLRVTMYQNAPQPGENCGGDDWAWASPGDCGE